MSAAVEQVITDSPRLPLLREYVINARTHRGVSIRSIAEMDLDMEQQWQEAQTQVKDRGETYKKALIRGGQAHFEDRFPRCPAPWAAFARVDRGSTDRHRRFALGEWSAWRVLDTCVSLHEYEIKVTISRKSPPTDERPVVAWEEALS